MLSVVRVARLARREVGELGRHRLAHDDRTRRAQPRDHRRIAGGCAPRVEHGTVLGRHVGGIEDVLDTDGHAVQRSNRLPGEAQFVSGARLRQGVIRIEERPGLDLRIRLVHPREACLDELLRADNTVADQTRGFRRRERVEIC